MRNLEKMILSPVPAKNELQHFFGFLEVNEEPFVLRHDGVDGGVAQLRRTSINFDERMGEKLIHLKIQVTFLIQVRSWNCPKRDGVSVIVASVQAKEHVILKI